MVPTVMIFENLPESCVEFTKINFIEAQTFPLPIAIYYSIFYRYHLYDLESKASPS